VPSTILNALRVWKYVIFKTTLQDRTIIPFLKFFYENTKVPKVYMSAYGCITEEETRPKFRPGPRSWTPDFTVEPPFTLVTPFPLVSWTFQYCQNVYYWHCFPCHCCWTTCLVFIPYFGEFHAYPQCTYIDFFPFLSSLICFCLSAFSPPSKNTWVLYSWNAFTFGKVCLMFWHAGWV
jgi:hypothetical protein